MRSRRNFGIIKKTYYRTYGEAVRHASIRVMAGLCTGTTASSSPAHNARSQRSSAAAPLEAPPPDVTPESVTDLLLSQRPMAAAAGPGPLVSDGTAQRAAYVGEWRLPSPDAPAPAKQQQLGPAQMRVYMHHLSISALPMHGREGDAAPAAGAGPVAIDPGALSGLSASGTMPSGGEDPGNREACRLVASGTGDSRCAEALGHAGRDEAPVSADLLNTLMQMQYSHEAGRVRQAMSSSLHSRFPTKAFSLSRGLRSDGGWPFWKARGER